MNKAEYIRNIINQHHEAYATYRNTRVSLEQTIEAMGRCYDVVAQCPSAAITFYGVYFTTREKAEEFVQRITDVLGDTDKVPFNIRQVNVELPFQFDDCWIDQVPPVEQSTFVKAIKKSIQK